MSARESRPVRRGRLYALAALLPLLAVGTLFLPRGERLRAAGPANPGHEQLTCGQCHRPAEGTVRQQLQANVRFLAGLRGSATEFVHRPVGNPDCVACHENEEDRHAPYRFNEPRFAEARAEIAPQYCVSCHTEHSGRRVTMTPTFCSQCHAETAIREDPIEPSHATLIAQAKWATCLSCHDFHGNHLRETPQSFDEAVSEADVARYLGAGPPIYGERVRFPARTDRGTR